VITQYPITEQQAVLLLSKKQAADTALALYQSACDMLLAQHGATGTITELGPTSITVTAPDEGAP